MITINNIPSVLSSFYDDIFYEISSDATALELKFKAELKVRLVGAASYETLSVDYVLADAQGSYFYHISDKLSTYIDEVLQVSTHATVDDLPHVIEYKTEFTEIYFNANGFFSEYDSTESSPKTAVGVIIQDMDTAELSDFIMGADDKRFLTNHPSRNIIRANQPLTLCWLQDESDNFTPVINIVNPPSVGGNIAFSSGFSIGFR